MKNETFAESLETFNYFLSELGIDPISENVARADFGIQGGETDAELDGWARDYASDCHTEQCVAKNEWRYAF